MNHVHGATLTIDLAALAANWRLLAERAGAAECGAVIKADAYGTGIEIAGPALWRAGCRSFFVAHLSEAIRARAVLPEATIFVLNGLPHGSAENLLRHRLVPVLGSGEEVAEWLGEASGRPCALHVDTGMNRLGFSVAEITAEAPGMIAAGLAVSVVMSHFTASEDNDDPATEAQARLFASAVKPLFAGTGARLSLLNSSGHFRDGVERHDLTRPGYALYGGNPVPGRPNPMRPVVRLEAPIIQLRTVEADERVGYNGRWTAPGPRRLATVSVGYADGYCRNASGTDGRPGGEALVGGVPCPIAGTVSMDLIILDVTDAPPEACRRGGLATLIGDSLDIDLVGRRAGTIGYEILTGLGRRYRRQVIGG
jgi:alanine racemase